MPVLSARCIEFVRETFDESELLGRDADPEKITLSAFHEEIQYQRIVEALQDDE